MELRTRQHLDTADRNRNLARLLLDAPSLVGLPAPPYGWAAVIAFYAAVHYVNAYLWERYRLEPTNHADRTSRVKADPILRRCAEAYGRLRDEGYRSRYQRAHRLRATKAADLVRVDLAAVERAVMAAL